MGCWEKLKCINREDDFTTNYAKKELRQLTLKPWRRLARISGENKIKNEMKPLMKIIFN